MPCSRDAGGHMDCLRIVMESLDDVTCFNVTDPLSPTTVETAAFPETPTTTIPDTANNSNKIFEKFKNESKYDDTVGNKITLGKLQEPVLRSQLISHNSAAFSNGWHHDIWAVDTRRVYNGYALYSALRPMILAIIVSENKCQCDSLKTSRPSKSLTDRWRYVQRKIEEEHKFNHVLHYIGLLNLPKIAVGAAKDFAFISEIQEDPDVLSRDEQSMNALKPYLRELKQMIVSDEEFDEKLKPITKTELILHNKNRFDNGKRAGLWILVNKQVFRGQQLCNGILKLVKRYDQLAYIKYITSTMYKNSPHRAFRAAILHFINHCNIPYSDIKRIMRRAVLGKFIDDREELENIDRRQLRVLLEELNTLEGQSDSITHLHRCAIRYAARLLADSEPYALLTFDETPYPFPKDLDAACLRKWSLQGRRRRRPRWITDFIPYAAPEARHVSLFSHEDIETADICLTIPWRDNWEAFDTSLTDFPWDVLPCDVISKDECTVTQAITWQRRESKPVQTTAQWMSKRRETLGHYFQNKYAVDCDQGGYGSWADSMRSGWEAFEKMCLTWQPGYINKRPEPDFWSVQPEPTDLIIHRHHRILSRFTNHRYWKGDLEVFRQWPVRAARDWEAFLAACDADCDADTL